MLKSIRPWTTEPPLWLALLVAVFATLLLVGIWGVVYPNRVVPVGWAVVLLCGLWFNRRWLVWTLTSVYAALILVKLLWLVEQPGEGLPSLLHLSNILVTATVVHLALTYREGLRLRLRDLTHSNADLDASNEELQAQAQELEQQGEELRIQSEELEQQGQQLENSNALLSKREHALHLLLHLSGPGVDEADMLQHICQTTVELLGSNTVAATVLEKVDQQMVLRAHAGFEDGAAQSTIPAERSLVDRALQTRQPTWLEDAHAHPEFEIFRPRHRQPFASVLVAPLWLNGEPLGGLEVYANRTGLWPDEAMHLIQWLADQCSRVWQVLRLRQDLNRRVDELQLAQTQLTQLNQHLEQRITERTVVAQRRANQLRALALQLAQTEQRERRQLARVLHDHLQQLLVAAKLKLGITRNHHSDSHLLESLSDVDALLSESIEASRSLTVELSPPILYDSGLPAALDWLAERKSQKYGLRITVDADPAADPDSDEIAAMLFSAARELLFNVMKHSGTNEAHIKLSLDGLPDQQQVVLCVEDHGKGFNLADVDSGKRTDRFGLFSIRERLLALGGDVQIVTALDQGTRVKLYAPREQLQTAASIQPAMVALTAATVPTPTQIRSTRTPKLQAPKPADDGTIRVLLADDHKILREGLAGLLREQPDIAVVGEASDGQMAVDLARQLRPHVIVMDVSMPKMNGIEATRVIHGELPGVRIIGLSMHGGDHIAQSLRDAGAEAYLTKGGPSDALVSAIRARDSSAD